MGADRGYGEASVDDELHDLGVVNVVIPRKGRPAKARQAEERRRSFRQHVKWRTGCEDRISYLKRNYGWDRTMIDTTEGAASGSARESSPTTSPRSPKRPRPNIHVPVRHHLALHHFPAGPPATDTPRPGRTELEPPLQRIPPPQLVQLGQLRRGHTGPTCYAAGLTRSEASV